MTIYTDSCSEQSLQEIVSSTLPGVAGIKVRSNDDWNISYIASIITDPALRLVVINNLDERSMVEIGVASFLCKDILLTAEAYKEYDIVSDLVTHIDERCNLNRPNNFITWYNHTYGK
jgi:hypothetical protein